jgi:hypothetical protein
MDVLLRAEREIDDELLFRRGDDTGTRTVPLPASIRPAIGARNSDGPPPRRLAKYCAPAIGSGSGIVSPGSDSETVAVQSTGSA